VLPDQLLELDGVTYMAMIRRLGEEHEAQRRR
jgi:hypothetical protein